MGMGLIMGLLGGPAGGSGTGGAGAATGHGDPMGPAADEDEEEEEEEQYNTLTPQFLLQPAPPARHGGHGYSVGGGTSGTVSAGGSRPGTPTKEPGVDDGGSVAPGGGGAGGANGPQSQPPQSAAAALAAAAVAQARKRTFIHRRRSLPSRVAAAQRTSVVAPDFWLEPVESSGTTRPLLDPVAADHMRKLVRQLVSRAKLQSAWEGVMYDLAVDVCGKVVAHGTMSNAAAVLGDMDVRHLIKFKKIPGGRPSDTQFLSGAVAKKTLAHRKMASVIQSPRIVILGFPLEYHRVQDQLMSLDPVRAQERDHLKILCDRVLTLDPQVVLVERTVARLALDYLHEHGVAVAYNIKRSVLENIARFTGADVIQSIDKLAAQNRAGVGTCGTFAARMYAHGAAGGLPPKEVVPLMVFDACPPELGGCVVLRGEERDVLRKVKEVLRFVLFAFAALRRESVMLQTLGSSLASLSAVASAPGGGVSGGTAPLARVGSTLGPQLEELSPSPYKDQQAVKISDEKDPPVYDDDLLNKLLAPYRAILSTSPGIIFPAPYLIERYRREVVHRKSKTHDLSRLVGASPAPGSASFNSGSSASGSGSSSSNTNSNSGGSVAAAAPSPMLGMSASGIERVSRDALNYILESQQVISPLAHQSIIFLSCTITDMVKCVVPHLQFIEYYGADDVTLAGYIEHVVETAASLCHQCHLPFTRHRRVYYHGNRSVTVTVHEDPSVMSDRQALPRHPNKSRRLSIQRQRPTPVACLAMRSQWVMRTFELQACRPRQLHRPTQLPAAAAAGPPFRSRRPRIRLQSTWNSHFTRNQQGQRLASMPPSPTTGTFTCCLGMRSTLTCSRFDSSRSVSQACAWQGRVSRFRSTCISFRSVGPRVAVGPQLLRQLQHPLLPQSRQCHSSAAAFTSAGPLSTSLAATPSTTTATTTTAANSTNASTLITNHAIAVDETEFRDLMLAALQEKQELLDMCTEVFERTPVHDVLCFNTVIQVLLTRSATWVEHLAKLKQHMAAVTSQVTADSKAAAAAAAAANSASGPNGSGAGGANGSGSNVGSAPGGVAGFIAGSGGADAGGSSLAGGTGWILRALQEMSTEVKRTAMAKLDLPTPSTSPINKPLHVAMEAAIDAEEYLGSPATSKPTPIMMPSLDRVLDDDVAARPPSIRAGSGNEKADGKKTSGIVQSLASSLSPLTAILSPTEHFVQGNPVILREDEPTSIVAFAHKTPTYCRQLEALQRKDSLSETPTADIGVSPFREIQVQEPDGDVDEEQIAETWLEHDPGSSGHIDVEQTEGPLRLGCRTYFAAEFHQLRQNCQVDPYFVHSMSRCHVWDASGGKSGSTFLKTRDDRFVIKQVSKMELELFSRFAPSYFAYMNKTIFSQIPTILAKIFGVYRVATKNTVTGKSMKLDFMVMENLWYNKNITKMFDLKGSTRNRHISTSAQQAVARTPASIAGSLAGTLAAVPMAASSPALSIVSVLPPTNNPTSNGPSPADRIQVLLDGNFIEQTHTAPLFVREYSRKVLATSIYNDTLFLSRLNIMDYSLVVGIDETNQELVVGIIDFIRTYTWDKKLETWVKETGLLGGGEPTIVSPKQYKTRFRDAMDRYFLMVPDKFCTAKSGALGHTLLL
ncbi:phosphatidylinositol-4-phosphate 5-kinase-domain-containing protein [Catenaria anguillulae PL171]|uniref:1-phosphatidylinositol-3-phosphate 5-kinase n=1 Tax=Catenaria anguillulae PL171 TaxID=765915 RepID=A0A1Y2HF96_9FUNG|nr:phosphatidylinositol-4-phosphate 5-kinase-domain-containing protein [Catenaria anguillulae PL171]